MGYKTMLEVAKQFAKEHFEEIRDYSRNHAFSYYESIIRFAFLSREVREMTFIQGKIFCDTILNFFERLRYEKKDN